MYTYKIKKLQLVFNQPRKKSNATKLIWAIPVTERAQSSIVALYKRVWGFHEDKLIKTNGFSDQLFVRKIWYDDQLRPH